MNRKEILDFEKCRLTELEAMCSVVSILEKERACEETIVSKHLETARFLLTQCVEILGFEDK